MVPRVFLLVSQKCFNKREDFSMSIFSRSRSKGHYPKQKHGGDYYKRHASGGIIGKILRAFFGSKKHSRSHSNHYKSDYNNKHHRKSSWS